MYVLSYQNILFKIMRKTLTKLFTTAFALVFLLSANTAVLAQNADQRTNLQIYGSALQYKGDLGHNWWKDKMGWGGGVSLNRYLSPALDAGLHLSYGNTEFSRFGSSMDTKLGMAMLGLRLKMYGNILKEDAFIGPYLTVGGGAHFVRPEGVSPTGPYDENFVAGAAFGGAGLRFRFSDNVSLFIETRAHFTSNDKYDNIESNINDRFLQHNIGLGFNLGKGKDTDGDGVPDRRDKCPDTPAGVQVDKDGCPIDTDGDGVPDYQDECPTEAGVANLGGCPDRDGDGVADKDDQCPDEPGTAATQGCPDSDGDGVPDKDDKCPDTPSGVQVGADGCPVDSDGDGVPDNEDLCPNSAGTAETKGCPELDARTKKLIEEKVKFEFDQARVQDGYRQLLDSIVVALEKYPDHVLLIKGHADHIGSEEYNQALSEQRAQAVKDYLIQRGVQNPDRLVTRGYGETQPLVQVNTRLSKARTAAARAQNRRVGFEMNTPDMQLNLD
ncbi:Thrombospondin type 3 repeat-containing protein [Pontibacter indicus]|uniref:Thrombospondin type 3 repeat-containing protein n=2 Tax=Pontibacter indicus TaxID=1317125 RepID=A0A1R3XJ96_9BACT|nr:Thrombospondin type 3 repeat-containing protein [Pontibacter indicus]